MLQTWLKIRACRWCSNLKTTSSNIITSSKIINSSKRNISSKLSAAGHEEDRENH